MVKKMENRKKFEELFKEKNSLYEQLAGIVEKERNSIEGMKIDELWKFMGKKQKIIETIAVKRKAILDLLDASSIKHNMNVDNFSVSKVIELAEKHYKADFKNILEQSTVFKKKVYGKAKENKKFIEEFLSVINGVVNIFTKQIKKDDFIYDSSKSFKKKNYSNRLISKEA